MIRLANYVVAIFRPKYGKDPMTNARAMRRLHIACEHAKQSLVSAVHIPVHSNCLHEGIVFSVGSSRAEFGELCSELFLSSLDALAPL